MDTTLNSIKYLTKYFWGLSFSLISLYYLMIFYGINFKIILELLNTDSIFGQGVIVLNLLIGLSIAGVKIQLTIISTIERFVRILNKVKLIKRFLLWLKLDTLLTTECDLAKSIFVDNSDDIIKYVYLKSWSQPEVLGAIKELQNHCERIKQHILDLKNDELIVHIDHYSSVTQEKAVKEDFRNSINVILPVNWTIG